MPGQLTMMGAEAALGGVLGVVNDARMQKSNARESRRAVAASKELTDYNTIKQLEMWEKTGYGAQKRQMKEAGLNPALMYGTSGGGGGSTSISAGSGSGGGSPRSGGEMEAVMGMGIQRQLLDAQRRNIEADTKLKEVEAGKKAGVDTDLGKTQILSLTQGIENAKAVEGLTKIETRLKGIEAEIAGDSIEEAKGTIIYNMRRVMLEGERLVTSNSLDRQTLDEKVKIMEAQAIGAVIENELKKQNIAKNKAEIQKMAADILQKGRELDIKEFEAEMKANFPSLMNVAGNIWQQLIKEMDGVTGTNTDQRVKKVKE